MAYGNTAVRRLYQASPLLLKDLIATGYGARHRSRKYGVHFHRYLASLRQSQWWSNEQHERAQDECLQLFVQQAAATVPYYRELFRELGLHPDEIRSAADLRHLPRLEKETVRAEGGRLIPDGFDR